MYFPIKYTVGNNGKYEISVVLSCLFFVFVAYTFGLQKCFWPAIDPIAAVTEG